jgi:glucose/arabinose dehydrogenase
MAMGTVTPILTIPDFTWNHNGGCLRFGPDGELYIGTGDGGGGGDPQDNGQDETQLLAKILRIHVDATTGTSYTIPAGNPFTGAGERPEIWATGVRNPWRFSFDRDTGDFWLGDVGQNTWEEIDVALAGTGAGANYGWSDCEGFNNFGGGGACSLTGHHAPIVTARHGSDPVVGSAVSITGGYVYRGSAIPALDGAYLFADLAGWVAALRYCDGTVQEYEEIGGLSGDCSGATVGFAEDTAGELYMVCIGDSAANGTIRRITAP